MVSVSVLALSVVAVALFVIPGADGRCPYGWTSYAGSSSKCVRKYTQFKTWWDALVFCINEDASLLAITSQSESNFIKEYLGSWYVPWWTAGHKLLEGEWIWERHGPIRYSDWGSGQPDDFYFITEDCLALWPMDNNKWHDAICYSTNWFVCQKRV